MVRRLDERPLLRLFAVKEKVDITKNVKYQIGRKEKPTTRTAPLCGWARVQEGHCGSNPYVLPGLEPRFASIWKKISVCGIKTTKRSRRRVRAPRQAPHFVCGAASLPLATALGRARSVQSAAPHWRAVFRSRGGPRAPCAGSVPRGAWIGPGPQSEKKK